MGLVGDLCVVGVGLHYASGVLTWITPNLVPQPSGVYLNYTDIITVSPF